jgi:hypothetical protein
MKKMPRKLTLAKETLRTLTDVHVRNAAGADVLSANTNCEACLATYTDLTCRASICNSGKCC